MQRFASYYDCLANSLHGGGSCGAAPSCSTSCAGGGGGVAGAAAGLPGLVGMGGGNSRAEQIGQLVGLGISLFRSLHDDDDRSQSPPEPPPPDPEELARARRAAAETEAARIMREANAIAGGGPVTMDAPKESTATVVALLDERPRPTSATSAVASLLDTGGSGPPAANGPAASVAALLAPSATPVPTPSLPAALAPSDPQFNAAFQASSDQPAPDAGARLASALRSGEGAMADGLDNLVGSARTLISRVANDPIVRWWTGDGGCLCTVPPVEPGDTIDQAGDKVFGQAAVGFNGLVQGMAKGRIAFAKSLYRYGANLVDRMDGMLGLATAEISGEEPKS